MTHPFSRRRRLCSAAVVSAALAVLPGVTAYGDVDAGAGLKRSRPAIVVPDVRLTDAAGRPVALAGELDADRPILLNFIFTSCTVICPVMSGTFAGVQSRLGAAADRVRMVSISIDPENDTPEALAEYAARFKAGPQWHLLTGRSEDIVAVQRAFGVYRGNKMNHAPVTFLRLGRADPWVRLDGLATAAQLAAEVQPRTGAAR